MVNVLLLVGIIVLAKYTSDAWQEFEGTQNVRAVLAGAKRGQPLEVSVKAPSPPEPPLAYPEFTVIPEKDLFMPERRPSEIQTEVVAEKAPPLPKPPSLNGVLNNDGKKQALITIFEGNNPKGQSRIVSIGDDVQGYTVTEIAETTMKMQWNDQEVLIDMFASSPQQQAAAPAAKKAAAVTVITIGEAAAPVETVTAEAAVLEERRGIEVGTAGVQGGVAAGAMRTGPGQGIRPGDRGRGQLRGRSGQGMTSGSGILGPNRSGRSVPFTSGTQQRNIR